MTHRSSVTLKSSIAEPPTLAICTALATGTSEARRIGTRGAS